ncbi:MAG TPA: MFS transporter [Dehalococcoidia bacterium]|nr:MFS transporter [Dehalococcoidia bacterium]MDP6272459.1 MFS transporter [Dehalococcoidia bacterium]MDP7160069.1 MFS transporter [Dehalococcoidia bacterium]MDP7212313.1 MFS transporter [Dehalococcoidia bacterium]MDP7513890.1 MFS transporter [Dehalococcoidia bacterium]
MDRRGLTGDESSPRTGASRFVPTRLANSFSSLTNRNFRYLWFGQVGAATAMHADLIARSWLVFELTGSSLAVAGVNMARAIPMLLIGLFGGVAADRWDRKRLLLIIQTWSLLLNASMAIIVIGGWVEMWHIYVLAFLLGSGMAMNQPVRTAIIPQLIPKEQLLNAVALNSIAINATRLIGPALIGLVIAAWGVGPAYIWSTVAYGIVIWTTTRVAMPPINALARRGSLVGQMIEGFRYIATNRLVLALVLLGLGPLAFGFSHQTLLPALVVDELKSDAAIMGFIMAVGGVGGIIGGFFMASRIDLRRKGLIMLISATIYGVALLLFAGVSMLVMVFPLIIAIGISQTVFRSTNTTTLLENTPEHLRGRIVSATLLDTALAPVAGIIAGAAADRAGVPAGYLVLGGMCLGIVVLALLAYPRIRKV